MINVPEEPADVKREHIDWLAQNVMKWEPGYYVDEDGCRVDKWNPFLYISPAFQMIEKLSCSEYWDFVEWLNSTIGLFNFFADKNPGFLISTAIMKTYKEV